MKWEEFYRKIYLLIDPFIFTIVIVSAITMLWVYLEEIYLGYINENPVDSVITMIYSVFVYLWLKDRCKKSLGE